MLPIKEVAAKIGIKEHELYHYGPYKAKVTLDLIKRVSGNPDGKLILVTAINPTPAGEGKTTTTVGLGQALNRLGKNTIIALREPSLGPVMGVKGGAAGGGYSQVVPMEDINLHFTGDMHAITAANNLLSALIDNHIQHGNELRIDPRNIFWRRVADMNDRALRDVIVGLGGKANGFVREEGFMITVASEVMAVLCLANDLEDLKLRLGEMIIAYNTDGKPVRAADLRAQGAMALLLKDAIMPNLVQTLENTPCFMHGGPFANIAHGCNSVQATRLALKLADYVITEAGFGADLGAEKFLDIKCRAAELKPDAAVIVATVRALKYNGGMPKASLQEENMLALESGFCNLEKHVENIKKFGLPTVVALNVFATDSDAEIAFVKSRCEALGVRCAVCEVFGKGGAGGVELAGAVLDVIEKQPSQYRPIYDADLIIDEKIQLIAREIYGAREAVYTSKARKQMERLSELGFGGLPICMAKTQYSLSDNPALLGRPQGFVITVSEMRVSAGAGFIVAQTGDIMTMPGLSRSPAAQKIDIKPDGEIVGLF